MITPLHGSLEYTEHDVQNIAQFLITLMPQCAIFTFQGTLGAGKTTLVKEILHLCGVQEEIQSPTFSYVHTYDVAGKTFYHFDLYRLRSQHDFTQAGFYEYLYQPQSWAFIEWPEIIMPLVQKSVCHCIIDYCGLDKRILYYTIQ